MLEQIAGWSLEAERDDIGRYFLRFPGLGDVEAGRRTLILGEHGSGKTALTEYLVRRATPERPTKRVAVRENFVAALPRPTDDAAASLRRAVDQARYMIALGVFEALIDARLLRGGDIRDMAQLFALNVGDRVEASLPHAFNAAMVTEIFSRTGERGALAEGLDALWPALRRVIEHRRVYVIFDESSSVLRTPGAFDVLKTDALRAFLGASRRVSAAEDGGVAPIVTARRQVFEQLDFDTQRAWETRRLDLDWTSQDLMSLAAFRAARAASPEFKPADINEPSVLRRIYRRAERAMGAGDGRRDGVWSHIWARTRGRPRDVLHFMRASARAAVASGEDVVTAKTLALAELSHSRHLLTDIAGELQAEFPDADDVIGALEDVGARVAEVSAVHAALEARLAALEDPDATSTSRRFIERLFEFSVIGAPINGARREPGVFRHEQPGACLDYGGSIVFHRGLWPALGLTGGR